MRLVSVTIIFLVILSGRWRAWSLLLLLPVVLLWLLLPLVTPLTLWLLAAVVVARRSLTLWGVLPRTWWLVVVVTSPTLVVVTGIGIVPGSVVVVPLGVARSELSVALVSVDSRGGRAGGGCGRSTVNGSGGWITAVRV